MPDLIEVTCACGKVFKARPEHAGRKGRCGACGGAIRILGVEPKPAIEEADVFASIVTDGPRSAVNVSRKWPAILSLSIGSIVVLCGYLWAYRAGGLKKEPDIVVMKEIEKAQSLKRIGNLGVKTFVSIELEPGKVAKVPGGEVMLLLSAVERGRLTKAIQALVDTAKQALSECPIKSERYPYLVTLYTETVKLWNLAPDELISTHTFYSASRGCIPQTKKGWEYDTSWSEYLKQSIAYPLDRTEDGGYEIKPIHEGKYFLYAFHNSSKTSIEWYAVCELEGDSVQRFDLSTKDVGFFAIDRRKPAR